MLYFDRVRTKLIKEFQECACRYVKIDPSVVNVSSLGKYSEILDRLSFFGHISLFQRVIEVSILSFPLMRNAQITVIMPKAIGRTKKT